jgi:hypothetical protein
MLINIIILAFSGHDAWRPNKSDGILKKPETRGPVPRIPCATHHAHLDLGNIQPRSKLINPQAKLPQVQTLGQNQIIKMCTL